MKQDLAGFRAYLGEFGLPDDTMDTYVQAMKRAFEEGGPVARLKSAIAPKSKRVVRAAARHWATWKRDPKLREKIDQIRLPAAHRQAAKVPLSRDELRTIMVTLDRANFGRPAINAVLGLMACRGFRDGDVLRMRRVDIRRALETGTLSFEAKGRRRLEFKVIRTYRRWLEVLAAVPERWSTVDELVCPGTSEPRRRRRSASRRIQRALGALGRELGIADVYPHRLRRTYAVEYLRAHKGDVEAIVKLQQHMQWANVATAMEYVNHLRDDLDDVAESMFDD